MTTRTFGNYCYLKTASHVVGFLVNQTGVSNCEQYLPPSLFEIKARVALSRLIFSVLIFFTWDASKMVFHFMPNKFHQSSGYYLFDRTIDFLPVYYILHFLWPVNHHCSGVWPHQVSSPASLHSQSSALFTQGLCRTAALISLCSCYVGWA